MTVVIMNSLGLNPKTTCPGNVVTICYDFTSQCTFSDPKPTVLLAVSFHLDGHGIRALLTTTVLSATLSLCVFVVTNALWYLDNEFIKLTHRQFTGETGEIL